MSNARRRHRQRPDGRVRRPGRAGHGVHDAATPIAARAPRAGPHEPACPRVSTSWATTTPARSPTTGPMPRTTCSRTTCSSPTTPGACPPTCTWSRSGRRSARNPLTPRRVDGDVENPNPDSTLTTGSDFSTPNNGQLHYAWTDITWLLHQQNVPWAYYVFQGTEPDCENDASMTCAPVQQGPQTPGIWNPLPSFTDVTEDGQLGNIQSLTNFFTAAKNGTLPAVSWIDAQRHRLRAPAGAGQRRPDLRHRADQRDHATAPTGTAPRSSSPGMTGAASTTMSCRRSSTATASACACPGS